MFVSFVLVQVVSPIKQLFTNITCMALLMGVHHMFSEAVGLLQKLVAHWTLELGVRLVIVSRLVLHQLAPGHKGFAASFACESFLLDMAYLTGMHVSLVLHQILPADILATQVTVLASDWLMERHGPVIRHRHTDSSSGH